MKQISEFIFGDMRLSYTQDGNGCVSMAVIPAGTESLVRRKEYQPEPLVQIHARGDHFANGYGNGHTLADTAASSALKLAGQKPGKLHGCGAPKVAVSFGNRRHREPLRSLK